MKPDQAHSSKAGDVVMIGEATEAVRTLLRFLGEDPEREGLRDTPLRVVRALAEMTEGYNQDPAAILSRTFDEKHDQMVVLRGIEFNSLCEHHLLIFTGTATVGYIPGREGQVVGISKLARLVQVYARRLQIQERMTECIARDIEWYLQAEGVGVVIKAKHLCMACRGVRQASAEMVTSCMLGSLRVQPEARAELLSLL